MAIKWVGAAWKTAMQTASAGERNVPKRDRVYIDFRQTDYPHVNGTPTYTALTSGTNWSGTHNFTGSYAEYLLDMPSTFTVDIRAKANFAFDVADDQPLFSWYANATHYFRVFYIAAADVISVFWYDGGTRRRLNSQQFDDGSSHTDIADLERITFSIDLTTGTTAGSQLWINGTSQDTAWEGNIDAKDLNYPTLEIRAFNTAVGDWLINSVRLWLDETSTDAEVQADFKDRREEEIFFDFNGHALGRTRCNVTEFVTGHSLSRAVEDLDTGSLVANRATISLLSVNGEFADDQYAAFDDTNAVYNGLSTQRYMMKQPRVFIETWYLTDFEPMFVGRVEGGFQRGTYPGDVSRVGISCVDWAAEAAKKFVEKGQHFEDKKIADATEADSLVHLITRLSTKKEVTNYAANSSFENATIGNSWLTNATSLTRQADPLLGANCGRTANTEGATKTTYQTIMFDGIKKLNVGEDWNFGVYLKSTAAATGLVKILERDSVGTNDTSTQAYTLTANGNWNRYDVTHTITDSDSDRLLIGIDVDDTFTVDHDCVMHTQNDRAYDWFVLNDNDGAAGVESADDADSASFDTCGFIVDPVAYVHPWARIEMEETIWTYIKQLADASVAFKCGFGEAGTFEFKAMLATGYADPSSVETLNTAINVTSSPITEKANRIIIRGVKITEDTVTRILWVMDASGITVKGTTYDMYVEVVDDGYFPDPATYGEPFIAQLGEVT